MLNVGLVGVGKMGISHLAILGGLDDVQVAGVCDSQGVVLSGLRSQVDLATFKSFDRMADDADLDAVVVATPTSSHFETAGEALRRGLHVFIEKPLALSVHDSWALAQQAEAASLANQVGYHNRFIGTFRELRRLVQAGAIGEVHHVDGKAFGPVVVRRKAGMTWRGKRSEGGGCLHDYASHVIDLMNFVVGAPSEVLAARLDHVYSEQVEDAVYALFGYASGASGQLEANWSDESYRKMSTTITVYGTLGKIVADRQECVVYLKPGHRFEGYHEGYTIRYITDLQEPVGFYLRGEEYTAQLDSFVRHAIAGDQRCENTFLSAYGTDWVIDQILRSSGKDA